MAYVQRNEAGAIVGVYRAPQYEADGTSPIAIEQMADDAAEVVAFVTPRRLVPKGLIVERLIAAGKIEAARAALTTLSVADQERWNAKPAVYADDERARALLRAIDADPAVILAP